MENPLLPQRNNHNYGEIFLSNLVVTEGITRFHYETWKALYPHVQHGFAAIGVSLNEAYTKASRLYFYNRRDLDTFMTWMDDYGKKFSGFTILPAPKPEIRYSCLPVRGDVDKNWVWILQNCEGHVAYAPAFTFTDYEASEASPSATGYLFFEKDNDRAKYQLSF